MGHDGVCNEDFESCGLLEGCDSGMDDPVREGIKQTKRTWKLLAREALSDQTINPKGQRKKKVKEDKLFKDMPDFEGKVNRKKLKSRDIFALQNTEYSDDTKASESLNLQIGLTTAKGHADQT